LLVFSCNGGESVFFVFVSGALMMISKLVGSDVDTEIGTLISSALAIEPNIIRNDRAKAITREILRFMIYLLVRYTQIGSLDGKV
jgi:hypothetical protein